MSNQPPSPNWWRQLQTKLSLLSNELGHKMADFVQKSLANDQGFKDAFVVVCLMGACKYRIATAPSEVGEVDEVDESTELNELNESFADQLKAFHDDFRSRPWMTYRHHFPPLSPTQQTSDVGWGCMIRCGQSMLAQCLLCHSLGRQWRLGMCGEENEQWNIYTRIIQQFIDSPTQRYSIHEITRVGSQFSGVDVGRWYGPSTIAQTLK